MAGESFSDVSDSNRAFQIAVWQTLGFASSQVDEMHKLIHAPTRNELTEVISGKLHSRVIAVPDSSGIAAIHSQLIERKLPVFSGIYRQDLLILLVPEGAQPLTSILTAISKDPSVYGDLFKQTGGLLRNLYEAGFGVPAVDKDTLLFDRLAFATSEATPSGIQLYLVPPYEFDRTVSPDDLMDYVGLELESSNLFGKEDVNYLSNQLDRGWHETERQS